MMNNTYSEADINNLNTVARNRYSGNDYKVNIEVEMYQTVIDLYKKIIDTLNESKSFARSNMITGELKSYYDSLTGGKEIDKDIDKAISDFEEIMMKIEVAFNTYEEIDEVLAGELNNIIATIFNIDKVELQNSGTTLEERKEFLSNMIKNFEDTLKVLKEEYASLFVFSENDVKKVFHLFDALGMDKFNYHAIYNQETGSYNVKELGKLVNYLEENKVSEKFNSYFKENNTWQASGMEAMFGEGLKNYYWLSRNKTYNEEENAKIDSEALFMESFMNGFTANNQLEVMDEINSHIYLYGSYCQEKYQDLEYFEDYFYADEADLKIKDGFNLTYEEWLANWENKQKEYYNNHKRELEYEGYTSFEEYLKAMKNSDSETSLDLINVCFTTIEPINGKYTTWYELSDEDWTKESALRFIKSYVANEGSLDILNKTVENYKNSNVLEKDIMNLTNTIYNYKQYAKIMVFDDDKKNATYLTKYLTKDYNENYNNEVLPEEWLKYLDRSEVALLDYLYNEKGANEAKEYIDAMEDIVNQRKGFAEAVKYAESLNAEHRYDENDYDIATSNASGNPDAMLFPTLMKFLSDTFPDFFDTSIDTGIAGTEGFFDGNYNFIDGFYDIVNADGVRNAKDYEFMYKMQLLASDNEYTKNLTKEEKEWLNSVYQFGNSLGYMTIPTLLSYVPVVGSALSYSALTVSSSGNSTEDLMQQGVEKEQSYLYGSLMGLSETAIEKLIGGLPGGADNEVKGLFGFIKSSLGEAGEEALQTYISAGISSMATGEPIDLMATTEEAYAAGLMAIFTSGFMNMGGKVFLKMADTVIETTPSDFNNYQEWRASIENDFRRNNSDVANILMGTPQESTELVLDIGREELNNLDSKQREMISGLTYNALTGEYQVTLINGNTFNVDNLDQVTNTNLLTNFIATNQNTIDVFNGLSGSLTDAFTLWGDKIKTLGGEVTGLTPDTITPINDFVSNIISSLKANVAKIQIGKLSGKKLENYMDSLDATMLTRMVKDSLGNEVTFLEYVYENVPSIKESYIIDSANKNSKVAKVILDNINEFNDNYREFINNLDVDTLNGSVTDKEGNRVTLLDYMMENNFCFGNEAFPYIPDVVSTNKDVIKNCIDKMYYNSDSKCDYIEFVRVLDEETLKSEITSENGDSVTLLDYARSHVPVSQYSTIIDNVKYIPFYLEYVGRDFQKANLDIILQLVSKKPKIIKFVDNEILNLHPNLVVNSLKSDSANMQYVTNEFQSSHPEIIIDAISDDPLCLQYVSNEFQLSHPDVVLEAVKDDSFCLEYVTTEFQLLHPEIITQVIDDNPYDLRYINVKAQLAFSDIIMDAIKESPSLLEYVSSEFQVTHQEEIVDFITKDISNFQYLCLALQCSKSVFDNAFKTYGISCIEYFHPNVFDNNVINEIKTTNNLSDTINTAKVKKYVDFIQNSTDYQINVLSKVLSKNPYLYKRLNYELLNSDIIVNVGEKRLIEMMGYPISETILDLYKIDKPKFGLYCKMIHKLEESKIGNVMYFQNYLAKIDGMFQSINADSLEIISSYIKTYPNIPNTEFLLNLLWCSSIDSNNLLIQDCLSSVNDYSDIEKLKDTYINKLEDEINSASQGDTKMLSNALMCALYGISYEKGEEILNMYYENFKYIEADSTIRNILIRISSLVSGKNLPQLFSSLNDYDFEIYNLSVLMEQYLKNAYSMHFMEKTFKVSENNISEMRHVVVNDGTGTPIETTIDIYELTDDSIAVIHVEDAYGTNNGGFIGSNNYKDRYYDFSERYASNHHLATSVVSSTKGKPAVIIDEKTNSGEMPNTIIYGYNSWNVESLILMGSSDIHSLSRYTINSNDNFFVKFHSSQKLLDNTSNKGYNELTFERTGLVPSYIVLYDSMKDEVKQASYQAAYDWNIPIVVIHK